MFRSTVGYRALLTGMNCTCFEFFGICFMASMICSLGRFVIWGVRVACLKYNMAGGSFKLAFIHLFLLYVHHSSFSELVDCIKYFQFPLVMVHWACSSVLLDRHGDGMNRLID